MKDISVTKIVKEIKFEGVLGEIESKKNASKSSLKNLILPFMSLLTAKFVKNSDI